MNKNMMKKETAEKIAVSLDNGTKHDVISVLLGLDQVSIVKINAYIELLKKKDNEQCVKVRSVGYFKEEVYDYLEERYKFHPVAKDPVKEESEYRADMLNRIGWLGDLVEDMNKALSQQTKALDELKTAETNLAQKITLLVNANLNVRK